MTRPHGGLGAPSETFFFWMGRDLISLIVLFLLQVKKTHGETDGQ